MIVSQALLIIILFTISIFLGIPVAFSICVPALVIMLINDIDLMVAPQMISAGVQSFAFLSVPFFIFAGNLMNTAGISKRIFNMCLSLIGHVRGGLAHVNVLASMVFAGISGSAAADVAGLGKIEMKAMTEEGYDRNFSAAITAASSILGPIIPPSVMFVVYASEAAVSVGDMFKAGLLPGILIGLTLMVTISILIKRGEYAPEPSKFSLPNVFKAAKDGILAIISPAIILFGMFSGAFTPTEAGVVAVAYSILIGLIYGELKLNQLIPILKDSAIGTANCMFMAAATSLLSWVVSYTQIPKLISQLILSITDNKYVFLIILNIFLLFLGCLIESTAGVLIITPILLPTAIELGISPIHFGIIACYNMLIGSMTPPMGAGIFMVCSIAETKFEQVVKKVLPFVAAHIVALMILTFIPNICLWLTTF